MSVHPVWEQKKSLMVAAPEVLLPQPPALPVHLTPVHRREVWKIHGSYPPFVLGGGIRLDCVHRICSPFVASQSRDRQAQKFLAAASRPCAYVLATAAKFPSFACTRSCFAFSTLIWQARR